jgi:hypothetical protein
VVDLAGDRDIGNLDMADPALQSLGCGNGIALHDPLGLLCRSQQPVKDR